MKQFILLFISVLILVPSSFSLYQGQGYTITADLDVSYSHSNIADVVVYVEITADVLSDYPLSYTKVVSASTVKSYIDACYDSNLNANTPSSTLSSYYTSCAGPEIEAYYNNWFSSSYSDYENELSFDGIDLSFASDDTEIIKDTVITTTTLNCAEKWSCTSFGACISGIQSRTCIDENSCGTTVSRPSLTQSCVSSSCTPSWTCTAWSTCSNSVRTRTCTDSNNCGSTLGKPAESEFCFIGNQKCDNSMLYYYPNPNYFISLDSAKIFIGPQSSTDRYRFSIDARKDFILPLTITNQDALYTCEMSVITYVTDPAKPTQNFPNNLLIKSTTNVVGTKALNLQLYYGFNQIELQLSKHCSSFSMEFGGKKLTDYQEIVGVDSHNYDTNTATSTSHITLNNIFVCDCVDLTALRETDPVKKVYSSTEQTDQYFVNGDTTLCQKTYYFGPTKTTTPIVIINADNVDLDCRLAHLVSSPKYGQMISVDGKKNTVIRNCKVSSGYNGISLKNSDNAYLFNNILWNNGNGISIEGGGNHVIESNDIEFNKYYGVDLNDGSLGEEQNVLSNNNLCYNSDTYITATYQDVAVRNLAKYLMQGSKNNCTRTNNYNDLGYAVCQYNCNGVLQPSVPCTPNWVCSSWSDCILGEHVRTCTDSNNCGVLTSKPVEKESCCSNLPAYSFTDPTITAGVTRVRAVHNTELCSAIRETEEHFKVFGYAVTPCVTTQNNIVDTLIKKDQFLMLWNAISNIYTKRGLTLSWDGVSPPASNALIRAVQMTKMREKINYARTHLCP